MKRIAIVGGGPAGLMAAQAAVESSPREVSVDLYDAMPSVGRKFLLAGKGGLNLTHSEPFEAFVSRYGAARARLEPLLRAFDAAAVREWARSLGIETTVGSSGRVFPAGMKAAPLLRAWLHRLRRAGVRFHARHRWLGWTPGGLLELSAAGEARAAQADAVVLALGGASWPQFGSDGAWVGSLERRGVKVAPLKPANSGFDVCWSAHFSGSFAGAPVKTIVATLETPGGGALRREGEFVITESGIEGGVIYALSAAVRDAIAAHGKATLRLDLAPAWPPERLLAELARPRGTRSLATHLRSRTGLKGVKAGLLREILTREEMADPAKLAAAIKALPLELLAARPLSEAISTAGGVAWDELDERLMVRSLPGLFCAGEMLDWEAPTGGYLLTACFATGRAAGREALAWLREQQR